MADLIPSDRRGERGQLILIAAFIIATSFVVLALVVNSAIFTENLATRDDVAGSQDALQHRHQVEQGVGDIVESVNQDNPSGASSAANEIEDNVEDMSTQGGIQQSTRGRVVSLEFQDWESGTKIAQDEIGNFSNTSTGFTPDWTVAESVNETRNFRINITNYFELNSADPFEVRLNGSNDDVWNMTINEDSPGNIVVVEVDRGGAGVETCRREFDDFMIIDVTDGTIDGEPCYALTRDGSGTQFWLGSGIDKPYRIDYTNVENIEGTYSMIVGNNAVPHSFSASDPPYDNPAVYNVTVSYNYYTTNVGYETDIRVAPGEVPP